MLSRREMLEKRAERLDKEIENMNKRDCLSCTEIDELRDLIMAQDSIEMELAGMGAE